MKVSVDFHWQPWCYSNNPVPPELVTYEASMTRLLALKSGEKPRILKRKEALNKASHNNCELLGQSPTSWLWQREILLGNEVPWLYGYTLTLPATRSPGLWDLHRIGSKPLGEKLFTAKAVQRLFFDVGLIGKEHQLWHRVKAMKSDIDDKLWARCSVFSYQGNPLLLYEVLFPECPGL